MYILEYHKDKKKHIKKFKTLLELGNGINDMVRNGGHIISIRYEINKGD